MIGLSGKCPGKKLSLMVTFLIATADSPAVYSITLSTSRNGNLHNNPQSIFFIKIKTTNQNSTLQLQI